MLEVGKSRPIMLLCGSSESSSKLLSDFRDLVKNVSDKTLMQHILLRSCHAELENRKLNGESNLEISYVNCAPQVLRGFYQNCRRFRFKLVTFKCNAAALDHIFIILSETWLTNDVIDPLLLVIVLSGKCPYWRSSVYIPPQSPLNVYQSHIDSVEHVLNLYPNYKYLFSGDCNLPGVLWNNDDSGLIFSSSHCHAPCIPEFFASNCFFQNNSNLTESLDSLVPPDPFHPLLSINFYNNIHVPGFNSSHSFLDFDNADYINIHNFISNFDWPSSLSTLSLTSAFNTLYDAFHQFVLRFVPIRHFKQTTFFHVWFTSELKQILFMKKKAHAKFKSTFNSDDYRHFLLLRVRYKCVLKKLHHEFVDRTELSINANPSSFWKYIKKQRFNSDIPKTLTLNGASSTTNRMQLTCSSHTLNLFTHIQSFDLSNNAYFTVDDVFHSLSILSGAKNIGPDGLPSVFLFHLRSIMAYPLFSQFRRSLDEGIFPSILKISSITPVHKSGIKSDISNYRPISIQFHLSKLFESFVLNSIKPSLNNIIIEAQHGFRSGKSISTCNLPKRLALLIIVLMKILKASGFGEQSWIGFFLTNRQQWVKLFGLKSNIFSCTSGVPQDRHLSPILFLLFVNSVRNTLLLCQLLCFADDMKLSMEINSAADCTNLQSSLDCFVSWCFKIGLKVSASKCRVMTFTRSRSTILFDYNIPGLTIERVDNLTNLGFKLTRNLNPSPHFAMITSRAFKVLGFIVRQFKDLKLSKSLKSLYCALVRPILEYRSIVWDPYTVSDINQHERVQHKCLRCCSFMLDIPHLAHGYTNIANILGLPTLAEQNRTLNIKFIRGLITTHIDSPCLLSQVNFKVPSHVSRSYMTFHIPNANTNYLQNEPLRRIMSLANEDPSFVDNLF
ncbi:hypothetical protein AGLY_012283 [Aphis glycines]|uniref:Reverse transcriptase domain-containing protein n=1 Tax=Aphis glycines TaxID=307491 RepID=A0A6G0TBS4_APHGL|nr:hypothetical protein AGLY_012283 [Aphis glycines]